MKILIADDDPQILRALRIILGAKGYRVVTAANGAEAVSAAVDEQPDVFLLDLGMPQLDGIEVIQGIRGWSQAPILVVSGRTGAADKVQALDTGADDYITKPFNPDELEARIAAVLRRTAGNHPGASDAVLTYPGVTIDLERKTVMADGEEVRLSRTEWELLQQLAGNAGRVMMHTELLSRIWGPEYRNETQYLRTWVSRLRAKLEPKDNSLTLITTYPGMGYRFESPPQAGR